jgi:3-phenylpropionate/trans-cinnamate dioxygenase ferredoxin subunit
MRIIRAEGTLQRDLTPAGPTVEALIDQTPDGGRLAVTEIVIPPGLGMREHDHGGSEALLVPLEGVLVVTSGTQRRDISSGMVVLLERGERVQLSNLTGEPFTMIVVSTSVPEPPTADRGTDLPGEPVQWVAVPSATLDQLEDDEAVHLDLGGHPICLARSGGAFYALLDECSHGHVELSEGEIEDGHVECWLHGSRFDLATGIPDCPPATEPVPVYPVRVSTNGVEVALPPSAAT